MNKPKSTRAKPLTAKLDQINPDAAGIDVGSREHYVAIPAGRSDKDMRVFGCFTPDLHDMARWLKGLRITTVAMESTGVYWIPVFQVLEQYGLDVRLVDARQARNVPGRKTDVKDCQWLQQLHSFGLLAAAFIPDKDVRILRSYWRHREELVRAGATQIHLMQKALEQMNVQLHKVLSDISGVSGTRIIRAIVDGQRDPSMLASLAHGTVKAKRDTIAKALTGDYHREHVFALRQAIELYDVYQNKILSCDAEIEDFVGGLQSKVGFTEPAARPKRRGGKNQPRFNLSGHLHRITGVDLTAIDGIDTLTAQKVISEVGFDMSPFPTVKHFSSWLGLCPNNQITGGKVKKSGTKKVKNRAADALRLAAWSLRNSNSALGAYYRRMRSRLGAPKAITATAHKLGRLVYFMLKHGQAYVDRGQEHYEAEHQARQIRFVTKRAQELGLKLVSAETGEIFVS